MHRGREGRGGHRKGAHGRLALTLVNCFRVVSCAGTVESGVLASGTLSFMGASLLS